MNDGPERFSARVPLALGLVSIVLLVGVVGAWTVGTEIAGAVVAPGMVQVESERQVVQHPDGGVVGEILARDGDKVAAGAVLLRLDGTFLRSELVVVEKQLAEIFARRMRLESERDGSEQPRFGDLPQHTLVASDEMQDQITGQENLFEARRTSLEQHRQQLAKQQSQIERQIDGIKAQLQGLGKQRQLIEDELANLRSLLDKGLVQVSRYLALERESAQLQGETGRLSASIAEAEMRISELGIESLRLADDRREEAITQLRDLQYSEIELVERRISLLERLSRLDVRAPVSGVIFGSRVLTLHSVIQPAEPMMYVVPGDQPLHVSARIDPTDIDQVFVGQNVSLMFTAFSRRTTPEVAGTVTRISADALTDEATGRQFYEAIVLPDEAALAQLRNVTLLPGMPVETFLKTEDRTPLSYLVQPLSVYFERAFREG